MKNRKNSNCNPDNNFSLEKKIQLKPTLMIIILISVMAANSLVNLISISQKSREYIYLLFQVVIFLFLSFLLWMEKQNLNDFHLDTISIGLFLIIRPIMLFIYSDIDIIEIIGAIIIIIISISLIIKFQSSIKLLPRVKRKTIIWGIIAIFVGISQGLLRDPNIIDKIEITQKLLSFSIWVIFYYFSQTVIEEEFIFRGFIWGYLRRIGWKDIGICFFQAILFWILHFYRFNYKAGDFWGLRFFIASFIYGLITWKTRSITPSIMAHYSYNTMDAIVVYLTKIIK